MVATKSTPTQQRLRRLIAMIVAVVMVSMGIQAHVASPAHALNPTDVTRSVTVSQGLQGELTTQNIQVDDSQEQLTLIVTYQLTLVAESTVDDIDLGLVGTSLDGDQPAASVDLSAVTVSDGAGQPSDALTLQWDSSGGFNKITGSLAAGNKAVMTVPVTYTNIYTYPSNQVVMLLTTGRDAWLQQYSTDQCNASTQVCTTADLPYITATQHLLIDGNKVDNDTPVDPGQPFTYRITFTNGTQSSLKGQYQFILDNLLREAEGDLTSGDGYTYVDEGPSGHQTYQYDLQLPAGQSVSFDHEFTAKQGSDISLDGQRTYRATPFVIPTQTQPTQVSEFFYRHGATSPALTINGGMQYRKTMDNVTGNVLFGDWTTFTVTFDNNTGADYTHPVDPSNPGQAGLIYDDRTPLTFIDFDPASPSPNLRNITVQEINGDEVTDIDPTTGKLQVSEGSSGWNTPATLRFSFTPGKVMPAGARYVISYELQMGNETGMGLTMNVDPSSGKHFNIVYPQHADMPDGCLPYGQGDATDCVLIDIGQYSIDISTSAKRVDTATGQQEDVDVHVPVFDVTGWDKLGTRGNVHGIVTFDIKVTSRDNTKRVPASVVVDLTDVLDDAVPITTDGVPWQVGDAYTDVVSLSGDALQSVTQSMVVTPLGNNKFKMDVNLPSREDLDNPYARPTVTASVSFDVKPQQQRRDTQSDTTNPHSLRMTYSGAMQSIQETCDGADIDRWNDAVNDGAEYTNFGQPALPTPPSTGGGGDYVYNPIGKCGRVDLMASTVSQRVELVDSQGDPTDTITVPDVSGSDNEQSYFEYTVTMENDGYLTRDINFVDDLHDVIDEAMFVPYEHPQDFSINVTDLSGTTTTITGPEGNTSLYQLALDAMRVSNPLDPPADLAVWDQKNHNVSFDFLLAPQTKAVFTYRVSADDPYSRTASAQTPNMLRNKLGFSTSYDPGTTIPLGDATESQDSSCGGDNTPPTQEATCLSVPLPLITATKTANKDVAYPGDTVTYTVTFSSSGQEDVAESDRYQQQVYYADLMEAVNNYADLDTASFSWDAEEAYDDDYHMIDMQTVVPAQGKSQLSFDVTVKDNPDQWPDDAALINYVVADPTETEVPSTTECVEGKICVATPLRRQTPANISVTKTVNGDSNGRVKPGDTLTYSITATNSGGSDGEVTIDDAVGHLIDDADLKLDKAELPDGWTMDTLGANSETIVTMSGTVAAHSTVTITYPVTVKPAGSGDGVVANFIIDPDTTPQLPDDPTTCDAEEPSTCTVTYVDGITATISADPVDGSRLEPSTDTAASFIDYTLTFTNAVTHPQAPNGVVNYVNNVSEVLDEATLVSGPTLTSPASRSNPVVFDEDAQTITVNRPLAPNGSFDVTYRVKVNTDEGMDDRVLTNYLFAAGQEKPDECSSDSTMCTIHTVNEVVEPEPDPTEDPEPTPDPTEDPEPTPGPTEDPEPTPGPTEDPEPTPGPTEDPEPTPDPTEDPEPTPDPTEDPGPTPEPTVDPQPDPTVDPQDDEDGDEGDDKDIDEDDDPGQGDTPGAGDLPSGSIDSTPDSDMATTGTTAQAALIMATVVFTLGVAIIHYRRRIATV